ncbi:MAG: hypothetical protein ACT4OS_02275 [Acidimicrobiales bacterium]
MIAGPPNLAVALAAGAVGVAVVLAVFLSAVATVVVPRGVPVRLTRAVFAAWKRVFALRSRPARTFEQRDRAMALYAPVSLVSLPLVWLAVVGVGYTAIFWALGAGSLRDSVLLSGSSLLTLGFVPAPDLATTFVAFSEAGVGLVLVALLITYLPSMYAAFSRREMLVTANAIAAGTPPSAVEMLERFHLLSHLDQLPDEVFRPWTGWFADVEESHTSLSALVFFRSPDPGRSWVTAAGVVLDAAAIRSSAIDLPRSPPAELCLRSGFLCLRSIANSLDIDHDRDPRPDDPISVTREEFDAACRRLAESGAPMRSDAEAAWAAFAGWRVNYDLVLVSLAALTQAPFATWSSDRSLTRQRRRPSLGGQVGHRLTPWRR